MTERQKGYGFPQPFQQTFPEPIISERDPSATDGVGKGFVLGQTWINRANNTSYTLTSETAGSATWTLSSAGSSDVDALEGDAGGAISPTAGVIVLAGGTNITTTGTGAPGTITFDLDNTVTLSTSLETPHITAGAGNDLLIEMGDDAAANKVSFIDSAAVEVASIDSDGNYSGVGATLTGNLSVVDITATGTTQAIGNSNSATTAGVATGTGGNTINLNTGINTGANVTNINSGAAAANSTVNILSGNASAGTQTLNVLTGTRAGALNLATGAAAHVIAVGSSSAGAITVDTAAGISLGAATVSDFTVTGAAQDLNLNSVGGSVNVVATQAAADAIVLHASDAIGGILIRGGANGAQICNEADVASISMGNIAPTVSRTITIGAGQVATAGVADTTNVGTGGATTEATASKVVNIATGALDTSTQTVNIASGNVASGTQAVNILTGTGTKTFNVGNSTGTTTNIDGPFLVNDSINSNTSINTGTSTGTISIGNSAAGAITADTAAEISLDAATASNFTVTGAGADLTLNSVGGSVLVDSTEDAALSIRLHANGGTSETIQIHSDQGTGVGSINLLSDVGGITLTATGLASADAINLEAPAGGVDIDGALQVNIASSQDAAGAVTISASAGGITLAATGAAGQDILATNTGGSVVITATEAAGDAIVLNASDAAGGIDLMAGTGLVTCNTTFALTSAASQIRIEGGAVTDFIGQLTLNNGTLTVANTNIAATDKIWFQRSDINGSTALGDLTYTISAAASFTVTSRTRADPTVTETNDDSVLEYIIIRMT